MEMVPVHEEMRSDSKEMLPDMKEMVPVVRKWSR